LKGLALKPHHLERGDKVWVYRVPAEANKTEHHDQERTIFIGPRAQKILEPWLKDIAPDEFVFSPARAEAIRQARRRAERKTPLWPAHLRHQAAKRKKAPRRVKRDHYAPAALRRAIKRACEAAGVPPWTPN
jgi:integrase